jgi:Thymidylate synthase
LKKQLQRIPNPFPILEINPNVKNIDDFKYEDFKLIGYNHLGKIKMDMAV